MPRRHLPSRIVRAGLVLFVGFASTARLHAQDTGASLLLKPESVFLGTISGAAGTTLAPQVDGRELSFADPQILVFKNTDQAEFISAIWKDASGQTTHQRDVFVVKPDYGVVVDYVYAKGAHTVARSFAFSQGNPTSDEKGAQVVLESGRTFRAQAIDTANAALSGKTVSFSSTLPAPAPVPTVLLAWTGTTGPKVESVKPSNPMIVKFDVTFPDGRVDHVAVAWEVRPLHLNGKAFKGWGACARQGPAGMSSIEIN